MTETNENVAASKDGAENGLNANDILIAEFEYAKDTASQAMEDRHKMVNYYLIIVGVLLNAVATLLTSSKEAEKLMMSENLIRYAVFSLLFTLFILGILYLLKLIRLRLAWFESALAMNQIKDYYKKNAAVLNLKPLPFRWTTTSLKKMKLNKNDTLFCYSAVLIILIGTLALCGSLFFVPLPFEFLPVFFILSLGFQFALYKTKLGAGNES
jgi:hypothetical protein